MSNIDKRGLREAAEKATKGRWAVEFDDEIYSTDGVNHEQIAMVFSENEARDAAFIAAANPATVLALLDELETADALNKHLELAIRKAEGCSEKLRKKAEAAEERVAELEAREVKLPQRYSMLHRTDFDEPYQAEMVYKQHQVLEALHDAGIRINGEV
ncbi:ead/Ea22-like family protein [Escherichia coli]|uniref:ead/Ea22-like family protein n=1 Tax=Escherichia coli TaxID=562 RepID=UPI0034DAFFF3